MSYRNCTSTKRCLHISGNGTSGHGHARLIISRYGNCMFLDLLRKLRCSERKTPSKPRCNGRDPKYLIRHLGSLLKVDLQPC